MVSFMQYINRIQFGFGALATLDDELARLSVRSPLLMTDSGVAAAGILDKVVASLSAARQPALFAQCPRHPTEDAANDALAFYQAQACDGIVAIGGGVVIDLAKAVALLATHPGPLAQYSSENGGSGRIGSMVAPMIAIPTTAGTGSEIGRGAGLTLSQGGAKAVFLSVNLVPKVAICDPGLTLTVPALITAATGIDALSHCLEAYLSPAVNPPVDAVALDGIRRLASHLPQAVAEPAHHEARWNVMMGAVEGGMCFWKGLGAAHALSNSLDSFGLHHGTSVGLMLPHALRFARPTAQGRLAALDAIFGCPAEDGLQALNERIGLPSRLGVLGVPLDALPQIAEESAASVFNRTTLRPGSAADYLALLQAAY